MRSNARISLIQLLLCAIAAIAAPDAQAANVNPCPQPLVIPMIITAHNGAQIKQNTPISGTRCAIRIVRRKIVRHTLILAVQTYVAGRITAGGKDLRTVSQRLSTASTTTLRVALSRAGLRALRRHRRLKIHVRVGFVPKQKGKSMATFGPTSSRSPVTRGAARTSLRSAGGSSSAGTMIDLNAVVSGSSETPGTVLFSGNFDTGDISQWTWGAQCANYGVPGGPPPNYSRGNLSIVSDVVAQGKYAGRFDLPAAINNNACEVLRKRTLALGTDDWYAQEVRFPSNWQEPSTSFWGLLLAQYDFDNHGCGPTVGLYAHADHVNLAFKTGLCVPSPRSSQYTSGNDEPGGSGGTLGTTFRIIPLGTALAGTWQQFVVHVHRAADSSGRVQGWWRQRGGKWAQTVDWHGYPTVQWTSGQHPDTNSTTADKIGAYRGPATFPISIWQDGFCVATSFSAAAGCVS